MNGRIVVAKKEESLLFWRESEGRIQGVQVNKLSLFCKKSTIRVTRTKETASKTPMR